MCTCKCVCVCSLNGHTYHCGMQGSKGRHTIADINHITATNIAPGPVIVVSIIWGGGGGGGKLGCFHLEALPTVYCLP